jgi:hypothetical protein
LATVACSPARNLRECTEEDSRGGNPGLVHDLWQLTQEVGEDGNLHGDPSHQIDRAQVCVEKRLTPGARCASYTLKRGRVVATIQKILAKMDPVEVSALTPLEQVIHVPSEEEEWQLLENVIDAATIEKNRSLGG